MLPRIALLATLSLLAGIEIASAAGSVRFVRGGYARIPFELRGGSHVWVRGVIGDSDSLWIVVDTGAGSGVMDDGLAKKLGLEQRGQHLARGSAGTQASSTVSDVTITMGDLSIHRERLDTIDLSAIGRQAGRPMDLVVGHELFESCVVRFDYPGGVIEVWARSHAPKDLPGDGAPLTFEHNHPYVEGSLTVPGRAPLRGRFVIDTGSGAGIIVAPDVAARESLATAFPRTLGVIARGVGGERRNRVGRATSFALDTLRFEGPLVVVPESGAGYITAPGTIGNLGGQLLQRCRVTFDYGRRRAWFQPGPGFDQPFEADMSGISFARDADGLLVQLVNPDTPAAEAGLREGDRVTHVDGQSTEQIAPAVLSRQLRDEGRSVRLGIRRGEEESTVTLVLRRLL